MLRAITVRVAENTISNVIVGNQGLNSFWKAAASKLY